ncbi:calphotin-like [Musca vetustissima]|uniref:calphotin-like n=1 Tax=Musca vetustissima TaxID=27455 RepID=UPI002AB71438|nr:calphotin-like [Musca vetustissima]
MKRITLVVVVAVLFTCCNAAENVSKDKKDVAVLENDYSESGEDKLEAGIGETGSSKSKDVHKRGVFHYGTLGSHAAWPKSYAGHYGYGVDFPSSFSVGAVGSSHHIHVPGSIKYHSGIQYKGVVPSSVGAVSTTVIPAVSTLSPVHTHQVAAAAAGSVPYVIRPGGAVVQSYSVTYPHHKSIVGVKPVHSYGTVAHAAGAAVNSIHQAIHHVPAQPIQPVVQTYVQPATAVAQAVPSVGVVAQFGSGNFGPVVTEFQGSPSFGNSGTFSVVGGESRTPVVAAGVPNVAVVAAQVPAVPNVPVVAAQVPAVPNVPVVAAAAAPQPQPHGPNVFYPVNIQPPIAQQPPTFVNVQQAGIGQQAPTFVNYNPNVEVGTTFVPVGGRPNQSQPDFGSNEAAPQIPVQATAGGQAEAELPAIQPEPSQEAWKPVLYQPPSVQSEVNRPSNTLLPPYGSTPAQGK